MSMSQEIRDRIEPLRDEVNLSAEVEQLFRTLAERCERKKWFERNAEALCERGKAIARAELAGA